MKSTEIYQAKRAILVNYLIGHYTMCLEKESHYTKMILIRSKSLKKLDQISFHLYRFIRGMANVLSFDTCGIKHQQQIEKRSASKQLSLAL